MSARRGRGDRGITLPLLALLIAAFMLMVGLAVDLGRQRADRRLAQAGADVIALDMMRVVEGRGFKEVVDDPATMEALSASADRNGFTNEVGTVVDTHLPRITNIEWGTVPRLTDGDSFDPYDYADKDDWDRIPSAVRITAERTTDYFFQPGEKGVERLAIAAYPTPTVNLAVGSVAAGFQPSIPNSVTLSATVTALNSSLAAYFGATVPNPGSAGFDLVGYRGLAAADVDLWRVAANAGFGSPNEMLDSGITAGRFFSATATALDQQAAEGDPNAASGAAQLRRFQTQMGVNGSGQMDMGETLHFAQGGDDAAAEGSVNVLDLLAGGAHVIDGKNLVNYSFTSGIAFPGQPSKFVTVDVTQHLVQPEQRGLNLSLGDTVQTAQARFQVNLHIAPLTGMASTAPVTIPLVVEAAKAIGEVDRMDCADPVSASEAEIDVTTSGVSVRLGTASNLTASTLVVTPGVVVQGGANLLNNTVLLNLGLTLPQVTALASQLNSSLTATSSASVAGGFSEHTFLAGFEKYDDVASQRAPGGVGAATIGTQLSQGLTASLGSSALNSTANAALRTQLSYLFTNLQAQILDPILQQAGVAIAGADLKAWNEQCEGAGLRLIG